MNDSTPPFTQSLPGAGRSPPTRILIVDADPTSTEVMAHWLSNSNHAVRTAGTTDFAARLLYDSPADILITAWSMPDTSGLDLCRALREDPTHASMYIIMLTVHDQLDQLVEAFDAGVDDFLRKPFAPDELMARVRAAVRLRSVQQRLLAANQELTRRVTEIEVLNQHLHHQSVTDPLTSLLNRRAALERLDELWAFCERGQRTLSVLVLDIDHFKSINDRFGHAAGDAVLRELAKTLRASARGGDVVARVGGEEFLIIMPETDIDSAGIAAERFRSAIASMTVPVGNHQLAITASLGICERRYSGAASRDKLIDSADAALYLAKSNGRNRICRCDQSCGLAV